MYFRNYRLWKTWLDRCLKSPDSEHPLTHNMLKGPKHLLNLHGNTFIIFFITLSKTDLENVSLSDRWSLGHFVHASTADDKYFLGKVRISCNHFKCNYLKKMTLFLNFFLKSRSHFQHLDKKDTLRAYAFRNLQAAKDLVSLMPNNRRFRIPLDSQHVKGSQTLVQSAWQRFYHVFSLLWGKVPWKMSLLVICKTSGNFANTLIADDKFSLGNREILQEATQIELCQKQVTFFSIFCHICEI